MAIQPDVLVIPSIHVATLLITGTSALYVVRQRTTEYVQVKNLLVVVHAFFMGVVTLELLRYFITSSAFLTVYTVSGTTLVLVDVFLLTLVALAVFYAPKGRALADVFRELSKHAIQAMILVLYGAYIVFAAGYLAIEQPFGPQKVPNLIGALQGLTQASCRFNLQFGSCQVATLFNGPYLDVLLGILLIFMAYPSLLLYLARSRSTDEEVRAAFTVLPIAWTGIGLDLLFFNGYLLNEGIDASALGYLIAAAAFAVTAATFRRATLLSAFFQPPAVSSSIGPVPVSTFSGRLGLETEKVLGKEFLLEVDPSVKYEESVKDFAVELGTRQYILFAFTSRGSPVYGAISGLENVRFFTMTTKVSYPKPGDQPTEVLVPSGDQSVLLNVLDKTITSNPNLKFGLVFDSVTDLILSSGIQTTYKFLKQAIEMASSHSVTAVFLFTSGAHNEKEVSIVQSLFSNQISYQAGQMVVRKTS